MLKKKEKKVVKINHCDYLLLISDYLLFIVLHAANSAEAQRSVHALLSQPPPLGSAFLSCDSFVKAKIKTLLSIRVYAAKIPGRLCLGMTSIFFFFSFMIDHKTPPGCIVFFNVLILISIDLKYLQPSLNFSTFAEKFLI